MANSTEYNVLLKFQSQVDKGLNDIVKELKNLTNELSTALKNVNAASKSASSGLKSAKTDTEGLSKVTVALQKDLQSAATKSDKLTTSLKRAAEQSNEDVKMYNAVAKALKGAEGHSDRFSAAILRAQEASKGNVSVFNQLHSALQKVEKAILAEATAFQTGSQAQKDFITVHNRLGAAQKLLAGETVKVGNAFYEMNSKGTTTRLTLEQLEARAKKLEAENLKLQQGLKNTGTSLKEAAAQGNVFDRAIYKISQSFQTLLSYFTAGASIYTFISGIKSAVGEIVNFDQALKNIQAVTGATETDMARMRDVILDVASSTKFSTTEVAEGMTILGQAGFSATESMQAIESVANLATATLSDFKDTADLVTTAIRAFHLEASDAAEVTDIFASAINNSKLTLDKIRTAMNYLGPVAEASNLSLQETTAVLGELANSGIRASTMGTGFRQVLSRLMNPSAGFAEAIRELGGDMEKLNPMTNDLRTIIDELSNTVTDAGAAFELFGLRGAPIVSALAREGVAGFDAMMIAVSETGTAAEMASKQLEGLGLKAKQIADKVKTLVVMFSEESGLTGAIRTALTAVQDILDKLIEFADSGVGKTVTAMAGAVIGVGALVTALVVLKGVITALAVRLLPSVAAGITGVGTAAGTAGAAASVTTLSGAMKGLGTAVGSVTVFNPAALALIATLGTLAAAFAYVKTKIDDKVASLDQDTRRIAEARQVMADYTEEVKTQNKNIQTAQRVLEGTGNTFYEYKQALLTVANQTDVLNKDQVENLNTMKELRSKYEEVKGSLNELKSANEGWIASQKIADLGHAITQYNRMGEEIDGAEKELQDLNERFIEVQERISETGNAFVYLFSLGERWALGWQMEDVSEKLEEMGQELDNLGKKIAASVRDWANLAEEEKRSMLIGLDFSEKRTKEIIENEKYLTSATIDEIAERARRYTEFGDEVVDVLKNAMDEIRNSQQNQVYEYKKLLDEEVDAYKDKMAEKVDVLNDQIEQEKITYNQALAWLNSYYDGIIEVAEGAKDKQLAILRERVEKGETTEKNYTAARMAIEKEFADYVKSLNDERAAHTKESLDSVIDAYDKLEKMKEEAEKEDSSSTTSTESDSTGSTASGSTASKKAEESSKKVAASYGKAATAVKEVEKNVSSISTKTSKWSDNVNEAGRHVKKTTQVFKTVKKAADSVARSSESSANSSRSSASAVKDEASHTWEQGQALEEVIEIKRENGEITLVQLQNTQAEVQALQSVSHEYGVVAEKTEAGIVLRQQLTEKAEEDKKAVGEVKKEAEKLNKEFEDLTKEEKEVKLKSKMKVDGTEMDVSPAITKINSKIKEIIDDYKVTVKVNIETSGGGSSGSSGSSGDGESGGSGGGHRLGGLVSTASGFFNGMIKNFTKFASGGRIPGFGGGDRIPIMAEAGEYVINKFAASRNKELLDAINFQQANLSDFTNAAKAEVQGYQEGGRVNQGSVSVHKHTFETDDGVEREFEIYGDKNNDSFTDFVDMIKKSSLTRRM